MPFWNQKYKNKVAHHTQGCFDKWNMARISILPHSLYGITFPYFSHFIEIIFHFKSVFINGLMKIVILGFIFIITFLAKLFLVPKRFLWQIQGISILRLQTFLLSTFCLITEICEIIPPLALFDSDAGETRKKSKRGKSIEICLILPLSLSFFLSVFFPDVDCLRGMLRPSCWWSACSTLHPLPDLSPLQQVHTRKSGYFQACEMHRPPSSPSSQGNRSAEDHRAFPAVV